MKTKKEYNYVWINSVIGIAYQFMVLVLGMFFRRVFLNYMGAELSGLTGLYSNIIDMINLCLAGIGVSALHKLYICNANGDEKEEQRILHYTLYFYCAVAMVMMLIGVICSIFIRWFINETTYSLAFLRIVFCVQIFSQCLSNIFMPYRFLLQAKEKNYVVSLVRIIVDGIYYLAQISTVMIFQNYVVYLVLFGARFVVQNVVVAIYANHVYVYTEQKIKFKWKDFIVLFSDIKDTIVLQISNFIYLSTDSIILSKFTNLLNVNLYGNYMVIITATDSFFGEINASLQSNIGNKIVKDDGPKAIMQYMMSSLYIIHFVASIVSVTLFNTLNSFVGLWFGKAYVLPVFTTLLFCINFYWQQINYPVKNILLASGEFELDKKIVVSAAIVNIVISSVLCKKIGIAGVVLGTLLCNLMMAIMRLIFYVYKKLKKSSFVFLKRFVYTQIVYILEFVIVVKFCGCVKWINNEWLKLLFCGVSSAIVVTIINLLAFVRCAETKIIRKRVLAWKQKRKQ